MDQKKKVVIVGAGPGGLSAAMLLAKNGHDVTIYEKQDYIGGRNSTFKLGDFSFELGPTFVMLPQVFEEVFSLAGRKLSDYLDLKKLDPMYSLYFEDGRKFPVYFDKEKIKQEIARLFPGDENGYDKYLKDQGIAFDKMYPCLQIPYLKWYSYFNPKLLKALPHMNLSKSIYQVLQKYFKHEDMRISMTFQSKYLGMSPWDCPGPFTILSYMEHAYGIYHPIGGVYKISEAMAKVVEEEGGKIIKGKGVSEIVIENGVSKGVTLDDGTLVEADAVFMNADFSLGMSELVKKDSRPSWSDKKLEKSEYSCSTFMLYLGVDKKYDLGHHNIFFAKDYKKSVEKIFGKELPEDPNFYIQNASVTDPTLAPEGKSSIYVLVPVPNLDAEIDWSIKKQDYRDLIMKMIKERTPMKDIEDHIEVEKIITPDDWKNEKFVFKGATFNLAHSIGQMLYLRPHNEFEDVENLFIVGGGTHPGSGLPTIVESGRIAVGLFEKKQNR